MNWQRLEKLRNLEWRRALSLQLHIRPSLRAIPYWVAAVIVGFVAVAYSAAFSTVINVSQWIAKEHPYVLFVSGPICFMLGAWLVRRFAPAAGGTGIPQVTAALNMDFDKSADDIDRALSLKVALVVIGSSLLCVLGSGGLGREGPMVQIAACLFYFIARRFSILWPYTEHRSWIIAGGAAGVAAAFNTPLAGIVFVLEELAQQHFHQFKTVVISAVIVAGMIAQWLSGRYLFLGYPRIDHVEVSTVYWAVLVGLACGVAAGVFELLISFLKRRSAPVVAKNYVVFAGAMGLIAASLAVFVDNRTVGGGIAAIQQMLFSGEEASWGLFLGRFTSTVFSHLSGCAGGFLAPALSLGAAIGSKIAWWVSPGDHNLLVMVGMAGFLSAQARAPFTALVIVMEMTDRHSAIFPLMITSLVSVGLVRLITGRAR